MNRITYALPLMVSALALVGCGSSSGGSDTESKSRMTLGITDAPVDSAQSVVVEFTGVTLIPKGEDEGEESTDNDGAGGEENAGSEEAEDNGSNFVVFEFAEPKSIDLLTLQGAARDFLLQGEDIPAGDYVQVRLHVNAEQDGVMDSFIVLDNGEQHELFVPSGSQSGLKLINSFNAAADDPVDFTIDFDLRRSVVFAQGRGYLLKPVLRLVETEAAGAIAGFIGPNAFEGQTCSEMPENGYGVYVYSGADVTPDDLGSPTEPLTTTGLAMDENGNAVLDENGNFTYEVGFLEAGEYTVAATCTADQDNPEADDDTVFVGAANVTVQPGATTTHDFQ